jgi:hypothetical protein
MIIQKLEKPKISTTKMICDGATDSKLEKYESINTCFSRSNFTITCGLMGSGKTSIAISLLKSVFKHTFHDFFVIMPEISINSISKKDNIFTNVDDDQFHLYHTYDEDTLEEIYQKMEENSKEGYSSFLLIDDYANEFKVNKRAEVILNRIIIKMRHLRIHSIFLLAQNVYQLPKKWREVATNLICFNLGKSQMQKLYDEFFDFTREQFSEIMNLYTDPHDFILMNLKHKRLFYKWDEIIFEK